MSRPFNVGSYVRTAWTSSMIFFKTRVRHFQYKLCIHILVQYWKPTMSASFSLVTLYILVKYICKYLVQFDSNSMMEDLHTYRLGMTTWGGLCVACFQWSEIGPCVCLLKRVDGVATSHSNKLFISPRGNIFILFRWKGSKGLTRYWLCAHPLLLIYVRTVIHLPFISCNIFHGWHGVVEWVTIFHSTRRWWWWWKPTNVRRRKYVIVQFQVV